MVRLMEKKPVLHAVVWILLYLVLVNIGEALSQSAEAVPLVTGALLLLFSAAMVLYLKKNRNPDMPGSKRVTAGDLRKTLYYLPLLLLALAQFAQGLEPSLTFSRVFAVCLLMLGTGFVEEMLFRGFLLQGIQSKSGVRRAILISGVTFGIGHIVNLLRGYGLGELAGQIAAAVAMGIVLALLAAITKNLLPGILFHILFNISGTLSRQDSGLQAYVLILIFAVAVPYAIYLYRFVPGMEKASGTQPGTAALASDAGSAR